MVLTRAAQLVPQQEPGWGRVRPLAPGLAGGNKMFPAGRAGWEEPVLGREPRPCRWHLAGYARMSSGSILESLRSHGVCVGLSPVPWGTCPHCPTRCLCPTSPLAREHRPGPLRSAGSSFPGLCSECLWGFSLRPVLRQLSPLLRERVIPHARPAAPACPRRRVFSRWPASPRGLETLPLSGARSLD